MQHYCKTILRAYTAIPQMIERIDKAVYKKAVKSHCGANGSTKRQMEEIVELIKVKNDLLLLRRITSSVFDALSEEARMLLKGKYVYRLDNQTVASRAGLSMRTFFRHLNLALDGFKQALEREECGEDWFNATYLKQSWIKRIAQQKDEIGLD